MSRLYSCPPKVVDCHAHLYFWRKRGDPHPSSARVSAMAPMYSDAMGGAVRGDDRDRAPRGRSRSRSRDRDYGRRERRHDASSSSSSSSSFSSRSRDGRRGWDDDRRRERRGSRDAHRGRERDPLDSRPPEDRRRSGEGSRDAGGGRDGSRDRHHHSHRDRRWEGTERRRRGDEYRDRSRDARGGGGGGGEETRAKDEKRESSHHHHHHKKHKKDKKDKKDRKDRKDKKHKRKSGDRDDHRISAVSGKRIKMKVDKSKQDLALEDQRTNLLAYLNDLHD